MSIESAAAFKGLASQDAGLRAEALAAFQQGGMEAVAALAAGRGYTFTATDAEAALAPAGGELSDLELEAVAGGKGSGTPGRGNAGLFKGTGPLVGGGVINGNGSTVINGNGSTFAANGRRG